MDKLEEVITEVFVNSSGDTIEVDDLMKRIATAVKAYLKVKIMGLSAQSAFPISQEQEQMIADAILGEK